MNIRGLRCRWDPGRLPGGGDIGGKAKSKLGLPNTGKKGKAFQAEEQPMQKLSQLPASAKGFLSFTPPGKGAQRSLESSPNSSCKMGGPLSACLPWMRSK